MKNFRRKMKDRRKSRATFQGRKSSNSYERVEYDGGYTRYPTYPFSKG